YPMITIQYFSHILTSSQRSILRQRLSSPEKRKLLCDQTDGVSYLPPAKIPKLKASTVSKTSPAKDKKTTEVVHRPQLRHPTGVSLVPSFAPLFQNVNSGTDPGTPGSVERHADSGSAA